MDAAALVARLLLAAVFAAAAVTKLRDRDSATRSVAEMGVGGRWARPLARALPLSELCVAVGLLIESVASAAAVVAIALLAVFTAAIVNALRHDRRPDCGCFGDLSQKPISRWTVVRNVVLMALALFVALHGAGSSLAAWLEAGVVATAVLAVLGLGRTRAPALGLQPLVTPVPLPPDRGGLEVGQPAPDFELPGACNEAARLAALRSAGRPLVLMFVSAGCGACRELHPHLHRWQVALAERLVLAIVMTGDAAAARELCSEHGVENVFVDETDKPLWEIYKMPGTPSAVAIATDGTIASSSVSGADAIEQLVRHTVRQGEQTAEAWKRATPVG